MELLKVFVGDGTTTSGTTVDTMIPGDLLIVDATTHTPLTISTVANKEIKIVSCINKNGVNTPVFSTPIKKANVKYIGAAQDNESAVSPQDATSEAQGTATITANGSGVVANVVAGGTYSLGIQIKEDLRMGTYNKNTEIIASHVCPSTAASDIHDLTSSLAKGFSANPLTSAGSPYQLVRAQRTATGSIVSAGNATVVPGGRQVTFVSAHNKSTGDYVGLGGGIYQIEKVIDTYSVILDTAYQGTGTTLTGGTAQGTSAAGTFAAKPTTIVFSFTGIAQTQKNRFDQFRTVDFQVITPHGNYPEVFAVAKTPPVPPIGSFRQVRDLEEKAYTNSNPLINYREFPFETFPLNATSGTYYCMVTLAYTSDWGYNMMQSNQSEFLQTAVVAAPFISEGQFDVTPTPTGSVGHFLDILDTWLGTYTVSGWGSFTFA
jgi:hypothetical protein